MLGDTTAFDDWSERDDPPVSVWHAVRTWIGKLPLAPWQAPSAPDMDLTDQPNHEVRTAEVPGTRVQVVYRHDYHTEVIDLMGVINLP